MFVELWIAGFCLAVLVLILDNERWFDLYDEWKQFKYEASLTVEERMKSRGLL